MECKHTPENIEYILSKISEDNLTDLLSDLRQSLVTPDMDFVIIAPVLAGDTRIINGDELDAIQELAEEADLESENGYVGVVEQEEYEDDDAFRAFLRKKVYGLK